MTTPFRIGTRGSPLAVEQTGQVAGLLLEKHPQLQIEMVIYDSSGDVRQDIAFTSLSDDAFTDQLEDALLNGEIDIAVHSFKDLPRIGRSDLVIGAVPLRADPRECIVSRSGLGLSSLPYGSVIGTSSERRSEMISSLRPDCTVKAIRGSVDSRMEQLMAGDYDAVVFAVAGLERLGLSDTITEVFDEDIFPYAAGQGALAVQCRTDNQAIREILRGIDNETVRAAVMAERTMPLTGVNVLVTRPVELQDSLVAAVESLGGRVVSSPLVRIESLPSPLNDPGAETVIAKADAVVFSSANGVNQAWQQGNDAVRRALVDHASVVVIGPGTARAVRAHGISVARTAVCHIAEGLVAALDDLLDKKVLWLRSEGARDVVSEAMRGRNGILTEWSVYRTVESVHSDFKSHFNSCDIVTVASPSTAAALASAAADETAKPIVCIGPITAEKAKSLGLNVVAVADTYSAEGIAAAIVKLKSSTEQHAIVQ